MVKRSKVKVTRLVNAEKGKGQGRDITWCMLRAYKSRTNIPRNTTIGGKVAHSMGNNVHQFRGL